MRVRSALDCTESVAALSIPQARELVLVVVDLRRRPHDDVTRRRRHRRVSLSGANLLLYSAVGWCPATLLLRRLGVPAEPGDC
ncbi:hypothetical protein PWJ90_37845, partial [Nocardia gipuzkoensis]|nr:hypothetical protein [Nocardia gipuzkoensis]